MTSLIKRLVLAALVVLLPAIAGAQEQQQDRWQFERNPHWPWPSERFNAPKERNNQAGVFDYYALVLSWSPTYCSDRGEDDESQCARRDGRRYAFVLHGLWPQYQRGWPSDCRLSRRPFVPEQVIDNMMDIMPSRGLIIHEYKKHGTCSGLNPDNFYGMARQLFEAVRIPRDFVNPFETQYMSPKDLAQMFVAANPALDESMIAVSCGGPGNQLREIRICYSKDGRPQSCGDNENPRKLCSSNRMLIQPVRSTARDDAIRDSTTEKSDDTARRAPIRRPKLIEELQ